MHSQYSVVLLLLALCAIAFAQNMDLQTHVVVARRMDHRLLNTKYAERGVWRQTEDDNLGGVTQCSVAPAFNNKPHQISIMVYGFVDGWLSITTNDGGLAFPIKTVTGLQQECIHGTASAPGSDGFKRSCVCDRYFAGPNCNTIWKVSVPLSGQQFRPLTYLTPTSTGLITGCEVLGARCTVGTFQDARTPWLPTRPNTQITITEVQSYGPSTLSLTVAGVDQQMKIPVDFQQYFCVHGFLDGSVCRCEEKWSGPDCNTPICDRNCGYGFCANTGFDRNECVCNQNYFTADESSPCTHYDCSKCKTENGVCNSITFGPNDLAGCHCNEHYVNSNTGGQCNKRLCDCNGLGVKNHNGICTCTGGHCTFTKSTSVFPGWCSSAIISQECMQGPNNYPKDYGTPCDDNEKDPWKYPAEGIEIALHIILALVEVL